MKKLAWSTVRVADVGEVQLGRQRSPKHATGDHMRPYLRVANVYEDRLELSDVLEMNFTPKEFETFELKPNDILLNEGQSLELVGRPAMYRGEIPGACFQNTLIRFRPGPKVEPKYALFVFRTYLHTGRFQKIARWTTNIAHLGAGRFAEMPFPLVPLNEQRRIVAEKREHLDDFVACCNPKNRQARKESERFKSFSYDELIKRDKVNLDIFWLKDEALEDSANLPAPGIIAQEIVADLEAALEQFKSIEDDLKEN